MVSSITTNYLVQKHSDLLPVKQLVKSYDGDAFLKKRFCLFTLSNSDV